MLWLARFIAVMPLALVHAAGALLGRLVWLFSPRYRHMLTVNLEQAGLWNERLGREAAAHAGRGALELPWVWMRDDAVSRIVQVEGWELVESAWQRQRGIVFLTPHLGCFEITAQYYAVRAPITVLYRPPRKAWLRTLVEGARGRSNLHLAPADLSGVRRMLKVLKKHEAVGLLPDQAPEAGEGEWLPFFSRPAYTMTLAARLSEVEGAEIILAYAARLPGGRGYRLVLRAMPEPVSGDTSARAAAINRALEGLIRECPEQYAWGYNRYKRPRGAPPSPEQASC